MPDTENQVLSPKESRLIIKEAVEVYMQSKNDKVLEDFWKEKYASTFLTINSSNLTSIEKDLSLLYDPYGNFKAYFLAPNLYMEASCYEYWSHQYSTVKPLDRTLLRDGTTGAHWVEPEALSKHIQLAYLSNNRFPTHKVFKSIGIHCLARVVQNNMFHELGWHERDTQLYLLHTFLQSSKEVCVYHSRLCSTIQSMHLSETELERVMPMGREEILLGLLKHCEAEDYTLDSVAAVLERRGKVHLLEVMGFPHNVEKILQRVDAESIVRSFLEDHKVGAFIKREWIKIAKDVLSPEIILEFIQNEGSPAREEATRIAFERGFLTIDVLKNILQSTSVWDQVFRQEYLSMYQQLIMQSTNIEDFEEEIYSI